MVHLENPRATAPAKTCKPACGDVGSPSQAHHPSWQLPASGSRIYCARADLGEKPSGHLKPMPVLPTFNTR